MHSDIIQIGDILVSSSIITEYFCCDYQKCKGVCCVIGDSGAPMEAGEDAQIENNYSAISRLMCEEGRKRVTKTGFFKIDRDGDIVTPLMKNVSYDLDPAEGGCLGDAADQPCAYACFESCGCLCSIEKAYNKGECSFVKPISCRLYPIRVSQFSNDTKALNLHQWEICKDAFEKGKKDGIRVYQFLEQPLIAAFGEDFYSQLSVAAKMLLARS